MKPKLALFFTFLFVGIIITPSVVTLVDENHDITIFLDLNEEEENKGKKSINDGELKVHYTNNHTSILYNKNLKRKNIRYKSKRYISYYKKILTPPPENLLYSI